MTTTETRRPPLPGSAELADVIEQIADDAQRRLDDGGTEQPNRAVDLIREYRLGAVRVPVDLGGGGWSITELFDLIIDLAEADPDVPHIVRVHYSFVEELLRQPRSAAKDRWLPHVVAGSVFGGASSELSSHNVGDFRLDSTLTPTPSGFLLNGVKFYSTGSLYSDFVRVTANAPEGGVVSVVVPTHRDGIDHRDDWDGIGQRHTGSGTTVFSDVTVHIDETLPLRAEDPELRPRQALVQLYLHAIATGILRSITTDASALLRRRARTFTFAAADEPRHDPQLLEIVGRLSAITFVGESAIAAAAAAQDIAAVAARSTGIDRTLENRASLLAAKVKVALEEPALRAAGNLFDIGGASATRESAHLDRHWRNLRTLFSHNPTAYKARAIGDLEVNDTPLPEAGFF